MSSLSINDLIVPAHVTQEYLKGYKKSDLEKIEAVFAQVKTEQMKKFTGDATPGASVFVLVAGSHGVGKSHLIDKELSNRAGGAVVCDADDILKKFVSAREQKEIGMALQADFNGGDVNALHKHMVADSERYMKAAEYIRDRLMSECVEQGVPVIMATNAKTSHICDFIKAVKKVAILETHICEAPLSIKIAGSLDTGYGIAVPKEKIEREHEAMRGNLKVLAAASDNLTIHWRQERSQPLAKAVVATGSEFKTDLVARAGFNAHFADLPGGISIESLMGARRPANDFKAGAPAFAAA